MKFLSSISLVRSRDGSACGFLGQEAPRALDLSACSRIAVAVIGPLHAKMISPRCLTNLSSRRSRPMGDTLAIRAEHASITRNTYDIAWYVQALNGKSQLLRVADGGVSLRCASSHRAALIGHLVAGWTVDLLSRPLNGSRR